MNIPNNIKTIAYAVLAIFILLLAFYGLVKYREANPPPKRLTLRQITQLGELEKIKALEERVNELTEQVSKLGVNDKKFATLIQLSEAQLELGKYQESLDTLRSIPEDGRNNSRYAATEIKAVFRLGDVPKARELAFTAIPLYKDASEVWVAYLEAYQDVPAVDLKNIYLEAIPATKSNVDVMIGYAKFSEKIGDKATAIAAWETARNVDPDNAGKYESEIARLR